MSSIVTGEAVVLELRPASFAARGLGLLIDLVAQLALLLGAFYLIGEAAISSLDEAASRALILTTVILVLVLLPVAVETITRGKSLGKWAMGLRIVRDDGGAIRFRHAVIRALLAVLEIYLLAGSVAFVASIFNERSKRLGDMLAGTHSMRERLPATPQLRLPSPAYLQEWARLADLGRLPDPLARRVSQFLYQAPRMKEPSRFDLAAALATEVSSSVSPPPPRGATPQDFLIAVMTERRERDFRRLTAQRERTTQLGKRLHGLPFQSRRNTE